MGRGGRGLSSGQTDPPNRRDRPAAGADPGRRRCVASNCSRRGGGERASRRFIEFFTASIRNRNTRVAHARAVKRFFAWCDECWPELNEVEATTVAAYIEQLGTQDTVRPISPSRRIQQGYRAARRGFAAGRRK